VTVKPIKPKKREWLLQARKKLGLSTQGIAETLGISPTHYNDIENGKRNPSIELSIKMADYLQVPVLKFLRERTRFEAGE
jgi:transcriptional regulator with XRE-family HTH domain